MDGEEWYRPLICRNDDYSVVKMEENWKEIPSFESVVSLVPNPSWEGVPLLWERHREEPRYSTV